MDGRTFDLATFNAEVGDAVEATAWVINMRGYPGPCAIDVLNVVLDAVIPFEVAIPTWIGPDEFELDHAAVNWTRPASARFDGPVALLVGPSTQSAAESVSMALVDADRATSVGQQTSGTNGNITGVRVQGNFWIPFTGVDLRRVGGAPCEGVGIVPTVAFTPTPQDMADGLFWTAAIHHAIEVLRAR
jgi:hypothetical protein